MDVVLRPVSSGFLEQVAFPAFTQGVVDAAGGLEMLLAQVRDERIHNLVELMIERGIEGSFFTLDSDSWQEVVYRLLFWEWIQTPAGWEVSAEYAGFAGDWGQVLHLALMLEHPRYPYWDEAESAAARDELVESPDPSLGIAAMLAGRWDPVPTFPPDQVLSTLGRSAYNPGDRVAIADWSYRPLSTVSFWERQLATKLGRLLRREETRLKPVAMPESQEILDYWLGKSPTAPSLTVAFSGLGQRASGWVAELGSLVKQIRSAASLEQGLTALVTQGTQESFG